MPPKPRRWQYQPVATDDESDDDGGGRRPRRVSLLHVGEERLADLFQERPAGEPWPYHAVTNKRKAGITVWRGAGRDFPLYTSWQTRRASNAAEPGLRGFRPGQAVRRACHMLHWLPHYDFHSDLVPDVTAGITVGVVCVAQVSASAQYTTS